MAHFPLINVMFPANAYMLFEVIIKIATFDMIPTDSLIQGYEDDVGLVSGEYIISDNFADFGFDSADPIKNLQVMFLFILFLVMFPVFTLMCKGLCFWSDKCMRCRTWLNNKILFNTYIRFGLEAFLELTICCLIRIKAWDYTTGSDKFHSFTTVILIAALIYLCIFALVFPQRNFG